MAWGETRSKLRSNAALDFLQRHIPQALSSRASETAPLPARVALPEPRAHVLAGGFSDYVICSACLRRRHRCCPRPLSILPGRSSTAPAWQSTVSRITQLLGFVGAQAAFYEYALRGGLPDRRILHRDLLSGRLITRLRAASFVGNLGAASGLLLGAGQVINGGVSEEMGATAFQAIIGAVFAAKGFPDSLAQCWPTEWAPIWQIITQTTPRQADPTTLLQTAMSAMQLQAEYEFKRYGPDHDRLYQATLILGSEVLSIGTQVTGSPATTKTGAKHEASAAALGV